MHWREIIRRPIVTEKSNFQSSLLNQYSFVVSAEANKMQIADAIELIWPSVKVAKVRVANMPAKKSRRLRRTVVRKRSFKKAIVTLEEGTIDVFEGV